MITWTRDVEGLKLRVNSVPIGAVYRASGTEIRYWFIAFQLISSFFGSELGAAKALAAHYGADVKSLYFLPRSA